MTGLILVVSIVFSKLSKIKMYLYRGSLVKIFYIILSSYVHGKRVTIIIIFYDPKTIHNPSLLLFFTFIRKFKNKKANEWVMAPTSTSLVYGLPRVNIFENQFRSILFLFKFSHFIGLASYNRVKRSFLFVRKIAYTKPVFSIVIRPTSSQYYYNIVRLTAIPSPPRRHRPRFTRRSRDGHWQRSVWISRSQYTTAHIMYDWKPLVTNKYNRGI